MRSLALVVTFCASTVFRTFYFIIPIQCTWNHLMISELLEFHCMQKNLRIYFTLNIEYVQNIPVSRTIRLTWKLVVKTIKMTPWYCILSSLFNARTVKPQKGSRKSRRVNKRRFINIISQLNCQHNYFMGQNEWPVAYSISQFISSFESGGSFNLFLLNNVK